MISLDGKHLNVESCVKVARFSDQVEITTEAVDQIEKSNARLRRIISSGKPIYGINTGFGIFSDKTIDLSDIVLLNRNLILSHAVGTGQPLDSEIVRAAMLIRANTLAKGYSGIRKEVIQTLIQMLNRGVIPIIPSQGSLGSSGDLCQLSHLALVLSRDEKDDEDESGEAVFQGKQFSGKAALHKAGIERIILGPKEGLALNNGATFSTAIAALTLADAARLIMLSALSLSLTLEAMRGCSNAFDPRIHRARNLSGQIEYARLIRKLIRGSSWVDRSGRVQDAYSLRCAPQVCGAVIDTYQFTRQIVEKELNAATDNPLIFDEIGAISGGNFHGEPVGLAMDYLKIALSELCAISERRIYRMLDQNLNDGLPAMLVDPKIKPGLNSGLMMPHYTAISLTLENQALANPDSTRSLPASASQEDHNANSMTAARHSREVAENTLHVLAIEIHSALRAISIRSSMEGKSGLGKGTEKFFSIIRSQVPYSAQDRLWIEEIETVKKIITENEFTAELKDFLS
jgi:histidine ammonia-lyase